MRRQLEEVILFGGACDPEIYIYWAVGVAQGIKEHPEK